jgi:hypothetical protein
MSPLVDSTAIAYLWLLIHAVDTPHAAQFTTKVLSSASAPEFSAWTASVATGAARHRWQLSRRRPSLRYPRRDPGDLPGQSFDRRSVYIKGAVRSHRQGEQTGGTRQGAGSGAGEEKTKCHQVSRAAHIPASRIVVTHRSIVCALTMSGWSFAKHQWRIIALTWSRPSSPESQTCCLILLQRSGGMASWSKRTALRASTSRFSADSLPIAFG